MFSRCLTGGGSGRFWLWATPARAAGHLPGVLLFPRVYSQLGIPGSKCLHSFNHQIAFLFAPRARGTLPSRGTSSRVHRQDRRLSLRQGRGGCHPRRRSAPPPGSDVASLLLTPPWLDPISRRQRSAMSQRARERRTPISAKARDGCHRATWEDGGAGGGPGVRKRLPVRDQPTRSAKREAPRMPRDRHELTASQGDSSEGRQSPLCQGTLCEERWAPRLLIPVSARPEPTLVAANPATH